MPADDVPDGYHGGRLGRGSWPLLLTLHHDLKLREIVPYSASVHASVMAGIAIHMLIAVILGVAIVHAARAFTPLVVKFMRSRLSLSACWWHLGGEFFHSTAPRQSRLHLPDSLWR